MWLYTSGSDKSYPEVKPGLRTTGTPGWERCSILGSEKNKNKQKNQNRKKRSCRYGEKLLLHTKTRPMAWHGCCWQKGNKLRTVTAVIQKQSWQQVVGDRVGWGRDQKGSCRRVGWDHWGHETWYKPVDPSSEWENELQVAEMRWVGGGRLLQLFKEQCGHWIDCKKHMWKLRDKHEIKNTGTECSSRNWW